MFKSVSSAEFNVGERKATLVIDQGMTLHELQMVCNMLTHYCVDRAKEIETEKAQMLKDQEEAEKLKEPLEEQSKDECPEEEKPKDE